jgi:hypothetical protein
MHRGNAIVVAHQPQLLQRIQRSFPCDTVPSSLRIVCEIKIFASRGWLRTLSMLLLNAHLMNFSHKKSAFHSEFRSLEVTVLKRILCWQSNRFQKVGILLVKLKASFPSPNRKRFVEILSNKKPRLFGQGFCILCEV